MSDAVAEERSVFLSTVPAESRDRRLALAVVLVSAAVFVVAAPFAKVLLAPVPAFLPAYQSALVISDVITAVLLYGQYNILRSRALLLLASGYLFCAFMAISHLLSFPGLFAAGGLLGAGSQTTAWLYFLWHGVFPLCVIGYTLMKNGADTSPRETAPARGPGVTIACSIVAVLVVAGGFLLLTTTGHDLLPAIMQGNRDAPAKIVVATASWMLTLLALAVLWRRQPHSVLDLWLMVVLCVWVFDIALASVLNAGRFDVGWYAGRIYGLAAATFLLAVLLLENGRLYARLAAAHGRELRERRLLQERSDELTAVNKELDMFSFSVAHDLRAPVRAVDGFARMLEEDYGERLDGEGRRLLSVVRESCQRMGQLIEDLLAYARLGRQPLRTRQVELAALVSQTMAELRAGREARRIEFAVGRLGTVEADPMLLKQALANLLGNAIKFTRDRDPAVVEVGCRADARVKESSVYYVKDNGAGFDMRQYDRLFGVFQRLHRNEEYEGTGVGLAIVERVITRHGGRVWAESTLGQGATFYFTLPGNQVQEMTRAAA
ncbi:MAG TPA: MASE4 domain-containing protein [Burkholderiales bacterium]|jgi:signal transduction histidine kinase|nr:MASE4 domain-containing protein [Burkholderiales bacterium]